jgi:hypothetical protein
MDHLFADLLVERFGPTTPAPPETPPVQPEARPPCPAVDLDTDELREQRRLLLAEMPGDEWPGELD